MSKKSECVEQDCPICLDPMSKADIAYPILCTCGFNFCVNCIGQLIEKSKDEPEMASDGNIAVKIRLQCPQCRKDLQDTIHDTLILRQTKTFKRLIQENDSELSASELRQKHDLGKSTLSNVLENAKAKYDKFSLIRKSSSDSEEGIEVHLSEADNRTITSNSTMVPEVKFVDTSLFNGLEYFMSEEEQLFVTELMTSGDLHKLAQAAQILNGVADLSRKGIVPSYRKKKNRGGIPQSTLKDLNSFNDVRYLVNASNSNNVHASRHTHRTTTLRSVRSRGGRSAAGAVGRAFAMGRTEKDRKAKSEREHLEYLKKIHPLPARMPNHIHLDCQQFRGMSLENLSTKQFPIHFTDDEWDGTIADAFSKILVRNNQVVTHKLMENPLGIDNILKSSDSLLLSEGGQQRVVISSIRGEAGRQGAQVGDVVTHLEGEQFTGSASELRDAIIKHIHSGETTLSLLLNADESTAEALKLRATVLLEFHKSCS